VGQALHFLSGARHALVQQHDSPAHQHATQPGGARRPTKFIKNGYAHEAKKCYLTWEEVQRLHAWQPLATQASLARQKDMFVAHCLCGLRYSDTVALLRPHIKVGA
jgi:hypothetical protein